MPDREDPLACALSALPKERERACHHAACRMREIEAVISLKLCKKTPVWGLFCKNM
jgi:hypothetical protein